MHRKVTISLGFWRSLVISVHWYTSKNCITSPYLFSDCGSLISSLTSSATASDGTNRDGSISNGRIPCGPPSNLPVAPTDDVSGSLADLPPPYSLTPSSTHTAAPPPSTLVAVRTSGTQGPAAPSVHTAGNPRQLAKGVVASSGNRSLANSRLNGDVFVIGTGENGCVTGWVKIFMKTIASKDDSSILTIEVSFPAAIAKSSFLPSTSSFDQTNPLRYFSCFLSSAGCCFVQLSLVLNVDLIILDYRVHVLNVHVETSTTVTFFCLQYRIFCFVWRCFLLDYTSSNKIYMRHESVCYGLSSIIAYLHESLCGICADFGLNSLETFVSHWMMLTISFAEPVKLPTYELVIDLIRYLT